MTRALRYVVAAMVVGLVWTAQAQAFVYWTDSGTQTLGRANLDATSPNPGFVAGASHPAGAAVDAAHVYRANSGSIGRANRDGTGVNQSFIGGANVPAGVAVDEDHIYWANNGAGTIGRANLDGSGVDQRFITDLQFPHGVAVDGGPAGRAVTAASVAFGTQPLGVFGTARTLTVTNGGHGDLDLGTARVTGAAADDFLIGSDGCSHTTLPVGGTCTLHLRFGPSATGARRATLQLPGVTVSLSGTGGPLPHGPRGPARPRGPAGQVRLVTCRVVKKRRHCKTSVVHGTVMFTIARKAKATLTRRGVRYATGTVRGARVILHARRRVPAGRYTLRIRHRDFPITIGG
jgi:hypothetical protein